jgi:RimJ/RimL family protein N-acetyltransferase
MPVDDTTVRLEPWGAGDLALLQALNDSAMTRHLVRPETSEQLADRQRRYALPDSGMFKVVLAASGEAVGSVGYWEVDWDGGRVYETGWMVLPAYQGRGIATAATSLVISRARAEGSHAFVYAFPSVSNGSSNAICRKLGFEFVEEHELEYRGAALRCNVWRLGL